MICAVQNNTIKDYNPLLKKWAKFYSDRTNSSIVDYQDFYQLACLVLLEALDSFEKKKGSFGPYLKSLLTRKLYDFSLKNSSALSSTKEMFSIAHKIKKLQAQGADSDSIIEELSISTNTYRACNNLLSNTNLGSSDNVVIEDHSDLVFLLEETLSPEELKLLLQSLEDNLAQIAEVRGEPYYQLYNRYQEILGKIRVGLYE